MFARGESQKTKNRCSCLKEHRLIPDYFNMVDRIRSYAHREYLVDYIPIRPVPKLIENAKIAEKYRKHRLSAQQLADELGVSKQMVLRRLRKAGVHGQSRGRDVDNFRYPNPAYGYKRSQGRLETNRAEMKIVRLIVELRDRQVLSFARIADELNRRGYRTRKGTAWISPSVGQIHKRWTGKV